MKIQPITSWQNGELKQANDFYLESRFDNLLNTAIFQYTLQNIDDEGVLVDILVNGELTITGEDYALWNAESDVNTAAYNWAATKLNLQFIS
jgi:hypothetical protein